MLTFELVVTKREGINSDLAVKIINTNISGKGSVWIKQGDREVNARSILSLLSLQVCKDDQIHITVVGSEETRVAVEIKQLLSNGKS